MPLVVPLLYSVLDDKAMMGCTGAPMWCFRPLTDADRRHSLNGCAITQLNFRIDHVAREELKDSPL